MGNEQQPALLAERRPWPRPATKPEDPTAERAAQVKAIVRRQLLLRPVDVQQLIAPDLMYDSCSRSEH